MRNITSKFYSLLAAVVLAPFVAAADGNPSRGLWVGEAILGNVNEAVSGIDANNNTIATDPAIATPTKSSAHLRIIFHVDGNGKVRLLKDVAIMNKGTNDPPDLALITDPALYPNYTGLGRRIASAAYDFGDASVALAVSNLANAAGTAASTNGNATTAANTAVQSANVDSIYKSFVTSPGFRLAAFGTTAGAFVGAIQAKSTNGNAQQVLASALSAGTNHNAFVTNRIYAATLQANALLTDTRYLTAIDSLAQAAANAAASSASSNMSSSDIGINATNAVLNALTNAINAPSIVSAPYTNFVASSTFQNAAAIAGAAATAALTNGAVIPTPQKQALAAGAALKALIDNGVFVAADRVVINELPFDGSISAGGDLSGNIYLGASHPTNPFYHRRHPDHTIGYSISRLINIHFDAVPGTNTFLTAGYGVDKLTGTYREEISGLHKPLGPQQNLGLITTGTITLNRLSLVDTLNQ